MEMVALAAPLTSVTTDVFGATLKRDSANSLYIDVDGDNKQRDIICYRHLRILLVDHSDRWSDQWGSGSSKAESYAVEKLPDGTFKLAIKKTDKYGEDTNINGKFFS